MENGAPKEPHKPEIPKLGGKKIKIIKPGEQKPDMKGIDKVIELDGKTILSPDGRMRPAMTLQKAASVITDESCDCGPAPKFMPVCECYKNAARSMLVGAGSMTLGFKKMKDANDAMSKELQHAQRDLRERTQALFQLGKKVEHIKVAANDEQGDKVDRLAVIRSILEK